MITVYALTALKLKMGDKDVIKLAVHFPSGKSPLSEIHFEAFQYTQRVLQIQKVPGDGLQTKISEYFNSEGH